MNVHHSLFCLIFLSLQVRSVDILSHYGLFGGNTTFPCSFHSSGRTKFFCRETCEGENLLIRTSDDSAQIGRYRTEYVREASRTFSVLSVSISELTRSDAGRYRCGLEDSPSPASFQDFRLVVVDDLLDGNKVPDLLTEAGSSVTVACSFEDSGRKRLFCRGECGNEEVLVQTDGVRADRGRYSIEYEKRQKSAVLLVTITQLVQSDSGRYRCKLDRAIRSDLDRDFYITVTDVPDPSTFTPTTTQSFSSSSESFTTSVSSETADFCQGTQRATDTDPNSNVLLLALIPPFIIVIIALALLLYWRKTSDEAPTAPAEQPEETPEAATFYENVREEAGLWRDVDVELYEVYHEILNTGAAAGGDGDDGSESEQDTRL
ncbi:polymeric immunoglobulin receptor-like [Gambusia affinis]|uniref:polymeric immunoglobulin receptor-like n=1 Tax=Gambusia affinis TaxID=33528 RepID=UPI001CDC5659|nr:polymeric immunoglobulin receptor-like [Gambusia affinis]XP_043979662.1 polymeric immunoglobulin receptor-like [Gambusia affinis]